MTTTDDVEIDDVLDRLVDGADAGDIVDALRVAFGTDSSLFVVDHDRAELRFLEERRTIPLDGPLADAISEALPIETDTGWWLPVPERSFVALGLHFDPPPPADQRDRLIRRGEQLGLCTPALRTRFEDFEQRRRSHDMSVAAELQWSLLPPQAGRAGGFNFASALEPAYEVAGDLFDYAYFDDALWVYSLDAMGHGPEATVSAVMALTAMRNARRAGAPLAEQMARANEVVHEHWHGRRFVTAAGCRLTGAGIDIVNAGHEPIRRRNGSRVRALSLEPSLPLGVECDTTFRVHHQPPLEHDTSLILLSDGSAEARDTTGAMFGAPGVNAALAASWNDAPLRAVRGYLRRVLDFSGRDRPGDDITAVVVSVDPGSVTGEQ